MESFEPAFPVTDLSKTQCHGMSLRDWFAAQALVGLIDGYDHEARMASVDKNNRTGFDDFPNKGSDSTYASTLAGEAYMIADAMLKARENQK